MRFIFQVFGMSVFILFWFVSTPVYFVSDACQKVDGWLSDVLNDLLEDW